MNGFYSSEKLKNITNKEEMEDKLRYKIKRQTFGRGQRNYIVK